MVKHICLLHVASVDLDRDFIEEISQDKLVFDDVLLHEGHLKDAVIRRKSRDCFLRQSVCVDWVKPVVTFANIIDNKDRILELLGGLNCDFEDFEVKALSHP